MKKNILLLCLLLYFAEYFSEISFSKEEFKESNCSSTKEFITVIQFFREKKNFSVIEQESKKIAHYVSKGCTGAAQRFISIFELLSQAGLGTKDAIQTALEFANKTYSETETFALVFTKAYLSEYLDLDLYSSIKLAKSLMYEFKGDAVGVREDFEKIIQFCINSKDLDLPKPQCGEWAAKTAKLGERFSGGIADGFIRTFVFAHAKTGAALSTFDALRLSELVLSHGPGSAENFIQAYKFGVSKNGLRLSGQEALHFAKEMAEYTSMPTPENPVLASHK
ncbi:MAG: hypothetical protein HY843_06155 [Bdellovibrio sp.]|nr:hypothetical protein [Bdellovibrio sp.]